MITDQFIDICFTLALAPNQEHKRTKSLFKDMYEVLSFYEDKISFLAKTKFDCLKNICKLKLEHIENAVAEDLVLTSDKFVSLTPYINEVSQTPVSEDTYDSYLESLEIKKKLVSLFTNYDKLANFVECVESGRFDTAKDAVFQYEETVKSLYLSLVEFRRRHDIQTLSSLDLNEDEYDSVVTQIRSFYLDNNAIPSGFQTLDHSTLSGGFEPSRLYIFAGPSGCGKSTLLINFLANAILSKPSPVTPDSVPNQKQKKIFIYVTLENLVDESFLRLYCCLFNKSIREAITEILSDPKKIQDSIKNKLQAMNSNICIYYFPAGYITPIDLMTLLDELISKHGKECIRGLFVDYLDLLRAETRQDYRLELSSITSNLKVIAVHYGIPVVTASQLNRSAYRIESSNLDVDLMSESIKKVEHSDFVALIQQVSENEIHLKVGKNRSGKKGALIRLKVDFARYKIKDCGMYEAFIPPAQPVSFSPLVQGHNSTFAQQSTSGMEGGGLSLKEEIDRLYSTLSSSSEPDESSKNLSFKMALGSLPEPSNK